MVAELVFPVVAHHRIIVDAAKRDDKATAALFTAFELVEPVVAGHSSKGGRYLSYSLSVRLKDRVEMARFDERLKLVPGLKMVL